MGLEKDFSTSYQHEDITSPLSVVLLSPTAVANLLNLMDAISPMSVKQLGNGPSNENSTKQIDSGSVNSAKKKDTRGVRDGLDG